MNDSPNDIERKLAGILSDPDAMSSIINIVKGLGGGQSQKTDSNPIAPAVAPATIPASAQAGDNLENSVPAFSGYVQKNSFDNKSLALLLAIKPFLSCERAQKLDMITQILKVVSLTEIFK